MNDYKSTLHMPSTEFPMRGNLGQNEPLRQHFWETNRIYEKRLKLNENNTPFVLPDGPPYANGDIHIGHALNKTLKDIIVRDKSMRGYYTRYVPGWDTHGLPIESALTNKGKVDRKKVSLVEFRRLCADYAAKQIERQKEQFKRLGILGEWETPYVTMDKQYEASQLEVFADMVDRQLIFKGLKPVFWSPSSETALAEAEIEYHDKKSPSIYVTLDVVNHGDFEADASFIIWTTTPWTIPANLAVAVHEALEYSFVKTNHGILIMAHELLPQLTLELALEDVEVIRKVKGSELLGLTYKHPLYDRVSPIVSGHHVTTESGTGMVHIAPGHGEDDFIIGQANQLDVLCPVDGSGHMTNEAGPYEGMFIEQCSKAVVQDLEANNHLIKLSWIQHSYPHDWRTKQPVIFRATDQWFASIETLKPELMTAVNDIQWIPAWGKTRMENMIKDRVSWCISRQRAWGVPIPVFYHENNDPILDGDIIRHVAKLFAKHGSNVWFEWEANALLPEGFTSDKSPNNQFRKETDILDVWFDSGTSHKGGMTDFGLSYPADLYLEGSDQYRGWFNSSLTTGIASRQAAPYKSCLTHGFVLDGDGRKMSKSLGNVVDPIKTMNQLGADILRLWVASVDYQADVRISPKMMQQVSEGYRKIRNTLRFMLGALDGFLPSKHTVDYQSMNAVDQFMLQSLDALITNVNDYYNHYAFDDVSRRITNYVTRELSAFYLDYAKDILYIEKEDDSLRRSAQTVIYQITLSLLKLLTPIIPHTTEEAYQTLPEKAFDSVYLENMPSPQHEKDSILLNHYSHLLKIRDHVLKSLEQARNDKIIGKSLEAQIILYPNKNTKELLMNTARLDKLFIVSACHLKDGQGKDQYPELSIDVLKAEGSTCARCWTVTELNDNALCERCETVLKTDF